MEERTEPTTEEAKAASEQPQLRLYVAGKEEPAASHVLAETRLARAQGREGRELLSHLSANRSLGFYASGLAGAGKSTLLLHLILKNIREGRACCVIDPHGDLVTAVMQRCPSDALTLRRILLMDPSDTERPIGLDLLDAASEREQDMAVQFMLSLYEELFLADHQGPVLHQSLSNGMRLLMETGGSLAELPVLFADRVFLKEKLLRCLNPWVRHYFEDVWLEIKSSERGEYLAYFTSKLARLLDDSTLRNVLGQKDTPDLEVHLNHGGVLLCRLSSGTIGEMNARLLGMILLHKLERITRSRSALEPTQRPPLNVYVDEFHELATSSLIRFLGAARKFNVALHLVNQRLETLPPRISDALVGSFGHFAFFRQSAGYGLEELAGLLFPRFAERELMQIPNYHALVRVSGADGQAHVGRLVVPEPSAGCKSTARALRACSRRRYGKLRSCVEQEILRRLGWLEEECGEGGTQDMDAEDSPT